MHAYFTFVAGLFTGLFEDSAKIDSQLISRMMPFLGNSLRSKIGPFKCAGLMIVCTLVLNTSLTTDVANNLITLILLKVPITLFEISLQTSVVVSQRLDLTLLPRKPIIKLIRRREELELTDNILKLMDNYDINSFLLPFWGTLFGELKNEIEDELRIEIYSVLTDTMDLDRMEGAVISGALESIIGLWNWFCSSDAEEASERRRLLPPKSFRKHVRAVVIRLKLLT